MAPLKPSRTTRKGRERRKEEQEQETEQEETPSTGKIKKIITHRLNEDNKMEFLVQWEDETQEDSWIPHAGLEGQTEKWKEYLRRRKEGTHE